MAEALGADVKWEEVSKEVRVIMPQLDSLQRQTTLLQNALASATPGDAVGKWAKGVKERNGALQFAVLAPEMQEQSRSDMVAGGSGLTSRPGFLRPAAWSGCCRSECRQAGGPDRFAP